MSTFKIKLLTTRNLASADYAKKAYEILNTWDYPPDRFDKFEPIRQPWANRDDFIAAWRDEGELHFGQVLIRRNKRLAYYAEVTFQFGENRIIDNKPPYHGFSVYGVKESQCRGNDLAKLVDLADRLFAALEMDYGFMCLGEEYDAKNVIKNVIHPDGSVEPRHVIGMKWPYCLPGLYWINYFGKAYLDRGFAANVLGSYPANAMKVGSGIRFQTNKSPRFFETAEGVAAESEMRQFLGESWFFDRDHAHDCDWIDVSLEKLRSPTETLG